MDERLRAAERAVERGEPGAKLARLGELHRLGRLVPYEESGLYFDPDDPAWPRSTSLELYDPRGPRWLLGVVCGLSPEAFARWQATSAALAALGDPRVLSPEPLGPDAGRRFHTFVVEQELPGQIRAGEGWRAQPLAARLGWVRNVARATAAAQAAGGCFEGLEALGPGWIVRSFPHQDAGNSDASGAYVGVPVYMSPERLSGERLTPAGDQELLGVLLYIALTGTHPAWSAGGFADFLRAVLERAFPPPHEVADSPVDRGLEQVCLRALRHPAAGAYHQQVGYPEVGAFLDDLERAETGRPLSRAGLVARARAWWRR